VEARTALERCHAEVKRSVAAKNAMTKMLGRTLKASQGGDRPFERAKAGGNPVSQLNFQISWIETVLTLHPVLPMRAAIVAAAALGILALANLTSAPPRAGVAQEPNSAPP
jgi:hypothetical protein